MARSAFPAGIESEIGGGGTYAPHGFVQQLSEDTPELRWPNSVIVYDRMRRTDGQVGGDLRAMGMPIRRTGWRVVGEDVDPAVVQFVETELGLTPETEGRRRNPGQQVSWDDWLRHALLSLPFGHMFFEPVYDIGLPTPGQPLLDQGRQYAHLAKLAPRLPRSLVGIDIDDNGDLAGIKQWVTRSDGMSDVKSIPRSRLVAVICDREGSDWTGTSILRTAYKHWMLKEMLERVGAMTVERNGMGLPKVTYPDGGDRNLALSLATQARAGEQSGIALPVGYDMELMGVKGTLVDPLPQIAYHDQAIGRAVLAMFLNLGHDTGARSLGETFVDFFTISLNAVIANLEETATEEIVRPLVELNFGAGTAYPEIVANLLTPQSPLTADALGALVTAGVITPDSELEDDVRRRFGLPPLPDVPLSSIGKRPMTDPEGTNPEDADPEDDIIDVPGSGGGSSHSGITGPISEVRARLAAIRRGGGIRTGGRR